MPGIIRGKFVGPGSGQIHGQAAGARERDAQELRGMGLVEEALLQGGIKTGLILCGNAGLHKNILNIKQMLYIGRICKVGTEVILHIGPFQAIDARPVLLEELLANGGQAVHLPGIHHGDGGRSAHRVILFKIVPADSHGVRRLLKQALSKRLIHKAFRQHFGRGEAHDIGLVPQFPGHLNAGHEAGVKEDVVQLHGNSRGKLVNFYLIRLAALFVLAHRLGPGLDFKLRNPAGRVGGKNHSIALGREFILDESKRLIQKVRRAERRGRAPGTERIPHHFPILAGIHPVQYRRRGAGEAVLGKAAQDQQYIGLPVGKRKRAGCKVVEVVRKIG